MKLPALIAKLYELNQRQVVALSLGVVFLVILVWWLLIPAPRQVRAANVFARSFSVGWVTGRNSNGCVVAMPLGFSWGAGPKVACMSEKSRAHMVEFDDMHPEMRYGLIAFDGIRFRVLSLPTVTTLSIEEESPEPPQPAYGSVFMGEGERVGGALVYVYTQTNQAQYPVGVLANHQGNYALDLGNLMRDGDSFVVEGYWGTDYARRIEADVRVSAPFPPLWLEEGGLE